jgi:4-hydroxybenzoate polyprenyltransferase
MPGIAPPPWQAGQEYVQELELVKQGVHGTATQFWRIFAFRNEKLLILAVVVLVSLFLTGEIRVWNLALLPPACALFYVLYWLLHRRRTRHLPTAPQSGLGVPDEPANDRVSDARGNSK